MTVPDSRAEPPGSLLAELTALLQEITAADGGWAADVTPASRLDSDLWLDSLDLAALAAALNRRYGEQVDLAAYLASLDIGQIVSLTVTDVAAFIADHR